MIVTSLLFLTPLLDRCGPGFMAKALYDTMREIMDVTVGCTTEEDYSEAIEFSINAVRIYSLEDLLCASVKYDYIMYAIGNNGENHGLINRLALMVPGLSLIHI
mgnify:CR=1 FL=1